MLRMNGRVRRSARAVSVLAALSLGWSALAAAEPVRMVVQPAGKATWAQIVAMDLARAGVQEQQVAPPFMAVPEAGEIGAPRAAGVGAQEAPEGATPRGPGCPPAPMTTQPDFVGELDINVSIPPDTTGAVGPSHVVNFSNLQVVIRDKSGGLISAVSDTAFFAPAGTAPFDPRVQYDHFADRWIATADGNSQSAASAVYFAISDTSDPTGAWTFYAFDADPTNVAWADFPGFGFNDVWYAISNNMFGVPPMFGGFFGAQLWVIDRTSALLGGPLTMTVFPYGFDTDPVFLTNGFALQPAVTYDAGTGVLHIIDRLGWTSGGVQLTRLSQITGTGPAPAWSQAPGGPFPGSGLFLVNNNYGFQINAAQAGTITRVRTNDPRFSSEPEFRNGRLWAVQSGGLPVGATDRTAGFWYELDPTLMPITGLPIITDGVFDLGFDTHVMFPSIGVNCANDVCIGMSVSDPGIFVSAAGAGRMGTDPPFSMSAPAIWEAGRDVYEKDFGSGSVRWGDYSATCVDPVDDRTIWTTQELADFAVGPTTSDDRWEIRWSRKAPNQACCCKLYGAATGAPGGGGPTDLYSIDDTTGAWAFIGPIGFSGVTGLSFHPFTGVLYGSCLDPFGGGAALITIDPSTGAGTFVGPALLNIGGQQGRLPDISFRADGVLFGYGDIPDQLVTINPATGFCTVVGPTGFSGGGNGMDFAPSGRLYATPFDTGCLVELNPATGAGLCVSAGGVVPFRVNALDFCPDTGTLYGAYNAGAADFIVTIDTPTGATTVIGPTILGLDAIAFELCCPAAIVPFGPDPKDGKDKVDFNNALLTWNNAPDKCDLVNGSFEDGSFSGWTAVTGPGAQLTPWNVAPSGGGPGFFGPGFAAGGVFFAQNGFDGDAGLFYELRQTTMVPFTSSSAVLEWQERIRWDMTVFGATQKRFYEVRVEPAGGGPTLATLYTDSLLPGTSGDTGYVYHAVDLISAGIAPGTMIDLVWREDIPQTFTGPAQFEIDAVCYSCTPPGPLMGVNEHIRRDVPQDRLREEWSDAAFEARREAYREVAEFGATEAALAALQDSVREAADAGAARAEGPSSALVPDGRLGEIDGIPLDDPIASERSAVVFDNGSPDTLNGNEMTNWREANDFALATTCTIGAVRFWTAETGAWDGVCEYEVRADAGGTPGIVLDSGFVAPSRIATGRLVAGFAPEFEYVFSLPAPLTLPPGVYWLSLHMSGDCVTNDGIFWETTSAGFGASSHADGTCVNAWFANFAQHAFQLLGPQDDCCDVLYAAATGTGGGAAPSSLYRINPATGAWALVGPIGFSGVSGLSFDPFSGVLYGSCLDPGSPNAALITIDPNTGAGTLIGPALLNIGGQQNRLPDISFRADGVLFGYGDGPDRLVTINPATGACTVVGPTGFGGGGNGMDFAPSGRLFATPFDTGCLVELNPLTGAGVCVSAGGVVPSRVNALEFCPDTGTLYGAYNAGPSDFIVTIDIDTGATTVVAGTITGLDAIAYRCPVKKCDVVYDVLLDAFSPPLNPLCIATPDRFCGPFGGLLPDTTYFWRVICRGPSGSVTGPVWSFSTDRDCQPNGRADAQDIASGLSKDCNGNCVPDECETCLGDLNGDNVRDTADLGLLLSVFLTNDCVADINNDGIVDTADLGLLLSLFLVPCP